MGATLSHDAFQPRPPNHWAPGALLAIGVHALLVAALAFSIDWRSSEPEGVAAELWSATPQIAAPRPNAAVEPAPAPLPKRVEPVVRAEPPPSRAALDAQIATERAQAAASAARDDALRAEVARKLALARRDDEREQARRAAQAQADDRARAKSQADAQARAAALTDAQAAKRKVADDARAADARQAAIREANLRKMMNAAGTSDEAGASGNAARTAGPSAGYAGRIKARIKPNIVLTSAIAGDPHATVLVRLAPDGSITGRSLEKSSGDPVYDDAVLRAIDRTGQLPRDIDGRVPSSMLIEFNPRE